MKRGAIKIDRFASNLRREKHDALGDPLVFRVGVGARSPLIGQ